MRKLILVVVTLLCSGLWAFAQSSSSSNDPGANSAAASQTGTSATMTGTGAANSIDGCLSGAAGSFTLRDKASGTTYNLAGDTSKLSSHVGEEVRVTGSSNSSSASTSSGPATSEAGTNSGSSMSNGSQTFNVQSVTKVSSTCSSGQ